MTSKLIFSCHASTIAIGIRRGNGLKLFFHDFTGKNTLIGRGKYDIGAR